MTENLKSILQSNIREAKGGYIRETTPGSDLGEVGATGLRFSSPHDCGFTRRNALYTLRICFPFADWPGSFHGLWETRCCQGAGNHGARGPVPK